MNQEIIIRIALVAIAAALLWQRDRIFKSKQKSKELKFKKIK